MAEKVVEEKKPTEKMLTILACMRDNGISEVYFASDIADKTGMAAKSVSPVLTALAKRGLVAKGEGEKEVATKNGVVNRVYKTYTLTDAGIAAIVD